MRGYVPVDPETKVSQEHFAVVHTQRPSRKRFPAGCVDIVEDAQTAVEMASGNEKSYAARIIGPSKSSEGQYIYYLVDWLEA